MRFSFDLDCGEISVKFEDTRKPRIGRVSCGPCGFTREVLIDIKSEPVVSFGDYIDIEFFDEEFQKIKKHIESLKGKDKRNESMLCYRILINMCYAKTAEAINDKDRVTYKEYYKWEARARDINCQLKPLEAKIQREYSEFRIPRGGDLQRYKHVNNKESKVKQFCSNCKSKIAANEKFCSVCGKKT